MTTVHVVVPEGIDDPARPSGGNTYDRRVCDELRTQGWIVDQSAVAGAWPWPDGDARRALRSVVAAVPDGAVVLIDGLLASTVPDVLVRESKRVRLVVLMHMPLGDAMPGSAVLDARARESAVLVAVAAVVTTSDWTRNRLLDRYPLSPQRVHVAEPGVDLAPLVPGTSSGSELLCVAAVVPAKGHDVLIDALAMVADLPWRCTLTGSVTHDPVFVDSLGLAAKVADIDDRVVFTGALVGGDLDAVFAAADALVLTSRAETYGMVVTEALARGLPVIASAVGGVPLALGGTASRRPGLLVPVDDPVATAAALRRWLEEASLRDALRAAARDRRATLTAWSSTAAIVARVLREVAS